MLKTFINEIFIPYFINQNQKFFINFFRFLGSSFLECLPISSSFFSTLLYKIKDEYKIEKDNVHIHLITGIASGILYLVLKLKFHTNININDENFFIENNFLSKFIIIIIGLLISIFYNYFFKFLYQWNKNFNQFIQLIIIICNILFVNQLDYSLIINNNQDFLYFFMIITNFYILSNCGFKLFDNYKSLLKLLWIKILISIIFSFLFIIFISNNMNSIGLLFFFNWWKSLLFFFYMGNIKYQNLLFIGFLLNNLMTMNMFGIMDIILILSIFIYRILDIHIIKKGNYIFDTKNVYNDNFIKSIMIFAVIIIINYLNIHLPIVAFNYEILSPIGLLIGFPIVKFLKKKYYKTHNQKDDKIKFIMISNIITILFALVVIMRLGLNYYFNIPDPVKYFLIGLGNSCSYIPGFSRMMMTFLIGFLTDIPLKNLIIINYGLAFCASVGQWLIYDANKSLNIYDIKQYFYKKINELLLLFSYKDQPKQGIYIIIILMIWSGLLMNSCVPYLDNYEFWQKCIFLRIIINTIGLYMTKYF